MHLFRDDLPFEPVVVQVDCAEISNIFRLMNHDCEPTVEFRARGSRVNTDSQSLLEGIFGMGKKSLSVMGNGFGETKDGRARNVDYKRQLR